MGSCPKRVVFRHEGPLFFGVVPEKGAVSGTGVASVRPDVPKASSQRTRYAEVKKDSVQFCRTSTVIGDMAKPTEVWKESSISFHTSCLITNRNLSLIRFH